MRLRPKLAESCTKSGPITTPKFGEGGGPDARSWANQVLAASESSSCHASVRKPAGSIASLRREALFLRPDGRERQIQSLGQAGRAIVVAHLIKNIGHCSIPRRPQVPPQTYDRFQ
jgi:hypothetical protein